MRLSERLDHMLRQHNYKRKRGYGSNKTKNDFNMEEFLGEVDSFIDKFVEEVDKVLPKTKR